MSAKTLILHCPQPARAQFATALRVYAEAAYPPGGSECAQVARAALRDAAAVVEGAPQSDAVMISRRLKPQVKAALEYYAGQFEAAGHGDFQARRACLLSVLSGTAVSDADWHRVEQADAG